MSYKYLYIDDIQADGKEGSSETPNSLAKGLSKDGVDVIYKHVFEFESDNFIKDHLSEYDGLLLDLRLDEYKDKTTGKHSAYTATEFAQHIRTLVTKGSEDGGLDKDLPIVLFSTDDKLKQVYATDLSSHNLFDRYLTKKDTPDNASKKLSSLAEGYIEIMENKTNLEKLMGLENLIDLDSRIFSRFSEEPARIPAHEYAQVILKDLIYVTGPLINDDILAARLGIDKENSNPEDWSTLKEFFSESKYKGVFSNGWNRWWMFKINDLFESLSDTYLSYMDANEKVELFKEKLSLEGLIAAQPIKLNSSTRYTTICKAFGKPMDEIEGFRVYSSREPKQWQEYEYASLEAFATGKFEEKNIKVHIDDKARLHDAIKELG